MTALAADRDTPFRAGEFFHLPCAATKVFYKGALIVLDSSGNAEPATAADDKIIVGVSQDSFTSTTAAAEKVEVKRGPHWFVNGDNITKAHIGDQAFAGDDATVYKAPSAAALRSPIGKILDVDSTLGVCVDVGFPNPGLRQCVTVQVRDLLGANAQRNGFVAPRAGYIRKIDTVLLGAALTVGNATLTAKIATVAVTGGVVTITQAASAIGDLDSATPTALHAFAAGDFVEVLVGGTNTAAASFAEVSFDVEFT